MGKEGGLWNADLRIVSMPSALCKSLARYYVLVCRSFGSENGGEK